MQNDVLFGILLTLINKKKVSARELSLKYEVSPRTVLRYIDVLCGAGVPVYTLPGVNGGISIMDHYKLDKTYFTENEIARLVAGLKSIATAFDDVELVMDKLTAMTVGREESYVLKSEQLLIDSAPWGLYHFKDKMSVIEKAIVTSERLQIEYHSRKGEVTTRIIEPHTLVLKDSIWYVYAFCVLRGEFRLFKIGRIKSIILKGESFERRPLTIENAPYNQTWYREENLTNIILEVNEHARLDVEEWLGVESVKQNKDGRFFAYAKVPFDAGLLYKIMSFGSNVRVVEPPKLAEMIQNDCRNILGLYEKKVCE